MISKQKIKDFKSLNTKKGRLTHKKILVEGKRIIKEIISTNYPIDEIWFSENFYNENQNFINSIKNISLESVPDSVIDTLADTKNSQGVIGIMPIPFKSLDSITGNIVILDNVSDPGNLGTIIRTADWFGVENIFLSDNSVDPYNSKVIRSAMGAHFRENIIVGEIEPLIDMLASKNFKLISADINAKQNIQDLKIDKNHNWGLLLGNEAHGISKSILNKVKNSVKIPQIGKIESLNLSVACSIFLYQLTIR